MRHSILAAAKRLLQNFKISHLPICGSTRSRFAAVLGFALIAALVGGLTFFSDAADVANPDALRAQADKARADGNFKIAYEAYRKLALAENNSKMKVSRDLEQAFHCLNSLGQIVKFDELVEGSIKVHENNWRLLQTAATLYRQVNQNGFIVAGKFERGNRRGQAKHAHSMFRDRARALQLYEVARKLAEDNLDSPIPGRRSAAGTASLCPFPITNDADLLRPFRPTLYATRTR